MSKNRTHQARIGNGLAARIDAFKIAVTRLMRWLEQNAPQERRAALYRQLVFLYPDSGLAKTEVVRRTCGRDLAPRPGDAELIAEIDKTVPPEIGQSFKAAVDAIDLWLKQKS